MGKSSVLPPLNPWKVYLMVDREGVFRTESVGGFRQHVISSSRAIIVLSSATGTSHQPVSCWTRTNWILIPKNYWHTPPTHTLCQSLSNTNRSTRVNKQKRSTSIHEAVLLLNLCQWKYICHMAMLQIPIVTRHRFLIRLYIWFDFKVSQLLSIITLTLISQLLWQPTHHQIMGIWFDWLL